MSEVLGTSIDVLDGPALAVRFPLGNRGCENKQRVGVDGGCCEQHGYRCTWCAPVTETADEDEAEVEL